MSNSDTKYNVLFLGNGNAARSIMAESIFNREGGDKFRAYSAGINAHVDLDQRAADLLKRSHFDLAGARPKNWTSSPATRAPRFDFIFTVCEGAALLPHSVWPGSPMICRPLGVPNPAFAEGNEPDPVGLCRRVPHAVEPHRHLCEPAAAFVRHHSHAIPTRPDR